MLIIRPEQVELFDTESERIFEQRLLKHLAALFPEEIAPYQANTEDEKKLLTSIRKRFDQAERYGIEDESDHAVYIVLGILSQRFKKQNEDPEDDFMPWAKGILEMESVPGHTKMAVIEDRIEDNAAADPRSQQAHDMIELTREQF